MSAKPKEESKYIPEPTPEMFSNLKDLMLFNLSFEKLQNILSYLLSANKHSNLLFDELKFENGELKSQLTELEQRLSMHETRTTNIYLELDIFRKNQTL